MSAKVYLGLGANLGDPLSTFGKCLSLLEKFAKVISRSKLYYSAPYGFADQPPFINAAVKISTDLKPHELLFELQKVEKSLGKKIVRKNGPRIIDLDILLYDQISLDNEELLLPHPSILERDFVLLPLIDLDPELTHPSWGTRTLQSALSELQQRFVSEQPELWEKSK